MRLCEPRGESFWRKNRNKGNGYYGRDLITGSLKFNLDVPRDRNGKFRPQVLTVHYQTKYPSYIKNLQSKGESYTAPRKARHFFSP